MDGNNIQNSDSFSTLPEVLDYLVDSGWKATKATLYRHKDEGKIIPRNEGAYILKDVEKYARTFLKQKSTGKRISERIDDLQRRKLERELELADLEYKRKLFAYEKEQEKYLPRDQMELELAARAGILEAGLKHWVQSRVGDWISTVNGDGKRSGELINIMLRDLDQHLNNYAATKEYQVIFEGDSQETMEDREDEPDNLHPEQ